MVDYLLYYNEVDVHIFVQHILTLVKPDGSSRDMSHSFTMLLLLTSVLLSLVSVTCVIATSGMYYWHYSL